MVSGGKLEDLVTIIVVIVIFVVLIVVPTFIAIKMIWEQNTDCCMCGDYDNNCCPCPNTEYQDEIEEHFGYSASSAGSWVYMCEEYKKAKNVSFECFY